MEATPFKTSDMYMAAYLVSRGMELLGAVPTGEEGRFMFVLIDNPHRDDFVEEWVTSRGHAKNLREFTRALTQVKHALRAPVSI